MSGLLFETSAHDPTTFLLVCGLMVLVAMIAAVTPALRAARVDPSRVLRSD
jgi:ABC-type lipoprotein release transport system permease subunit